MRIRVVRCHAPYFCYHLLLPHDVSLLDDKDYRLLNEGVVEVKQMLSALIKRLKSKGLNSDG
jgi:hypothetical protein